MKKQLHCIQLINDVPYKELILVQFCYFMQIGPDESWLFFDQEAPVLHNKVDFMISFELCSCDEKQF